MSLKNKAAFCIGPPFFIPAIPATLAPDSFESATMQFSRKFYLLAIATLFSFPVQAQQYVCMDSNQGYFCMQLFPDEAPLTVSNFLNYVTDGDYTNSLVHRSVANFVIQGGGFYGSADTLGTRVPTDPAVTNEFSRSNLRGTVAMARNGGIVNSATSQWFVNIVNNTFLDSVDEGFTVFAEIVAGMEVVDAINDLRRVNLSTALGNSAFGEVPVTTPATTNTVALEDFVVIKEAWATDTLPNPYYCSPKTQATALTEFCGSRLSLPVQIGSTYYKASLILQSTSPTLVFTVDKSSLTPLTTPPAEFATFNAATSELSIPSVRSGAKTFNNVVLDLSNKSSLEFTLSSFTKG